MKFIKEIKLAPVYTGEDFVYDVTFLYTDGTEDWFLEMEEKFLKTFIEDAMSDMKKRFCK